MDLPELFLFTFLPNYSFFVFKPKEEVSFLVYYRIRGDINMDQDILTKKDVQAKSSGEKMLQNITAIQFMAQTIAYNMVYF